MARNRIKLAGGKYINLKALSGAESLEYREVVLTTDTHELFAGTETGDFTLLGNVTIGTKSRLGATDPLYGRLFFDYENGILYVGTDLSWKRCGIVVGNRSALSIDAFTGELFINTDNESIIINDNNALAVNNTDYGSF